MYVTGRALSVRPSVYTHMHVHLGRVGFRGEQARHYPGRPHGRAVCMYVYLYMCMYVYPSIYLHIGRAGAGEQAGHYPGRLHGRAHQAAGQGALLSELSLSHTLYIFLDIYTYILCVCPT